MKVCFIINIFVNYWHPILEFILMKWYLMYAFIVHLYNAVSSQYNIGSCKLNTIIL